MHLVSAASVDLADPEAESGTVTGSRVTVKYKARIGLLTAKYSRAPLQAPGSTVAMVRQSIAHIEFVQFN